MTQLDDDLDLEVLRSINSEVSADPQTLADIRQRVLTPQPSRRPGWPTLAAAGVALVAIGSAAALVLPHLGAPVATPSVIASEQPSVAQFTADAARAITLSASKPQDNQWVKITLVNEWIGYTNAVGDKVTKTDHPHTIHRITETVYVPPSNSKRWVRVVDWRDIPLSADATKMCATGGCHARSKPQRARHGNFPVSEYDETSWEPPRIALAGLTADPTALLAKARSELPAPIRNDPSQQLAWFAGKMGNTWVADAELRAAMFTAIGAIDGVRLQTGVTIKGHTGTALAAASTHSDNVYQLVFDPKDYRLIGWRITGDGAPTEALYESELVSSAP